MIDRTKSAEMKWWNAECVEKQRICGFGARGIDACIWKVRSFAFCVACTCASLHTFSGVCGFRVRGIDACVWKVRSSAFFEWWRGHVVPARVKILHNYSGVGKADVIAIVLFNRGKPVSLYLLLRRPAKTLFLQDHCVCATTLFQQHLQPTTTTNW